MNMDFTNIATILSVLIMCFFLFITVRDNRKNKRNQTSDGTQSKSDQSDYEKVLQSTHWLETEREKNQGEHFDNEDVYLNRAANIRKSSPYFEWVKTF